MTSLKLPLEILSNGLSRQEDEKASIDAMIATLISSSRSDCIADPQFGFVFNSFAFENFNETEGRIACCSATENKKLSGTSRSVDTFASELCDCIREYEKRLEGVVTSMTYISKDKTIYIEIKGTVKSTMTPYQYNTTIRVWK